MAYGTINADVIGTSVANTSLGAGNASIMKNRIINGAMMISQRNGTSSVTPASGDYILDRFVFSASQSSKFTAQQNQNSVSTPAGFINYLGYTSSSSYSVLSTDYFFTWQKIEGLNVADLGWGTANAKTVTLSFQVYSSLTGTFSGALRNSDNTRSYPYSYTVSSANTWTQISVTIAGDTSGTWLTTNGVGIAVLFNLGTGSTYLGTAGAWAGANYVGATGSVSVVGTSGATFYITGVQLEVGSSATGFEYVNYQTSLANCQRYFQTAASGAGVFSNTSTAQITFPFATAMRSNPTVSATNGGAFGFWFYSGSNPGFSSISTIYGDASKSGLNITMNLNSNGAGGQGTVMYLVAGNVGTINFSAEL